jgi:uncharacterized protein (DUF4415 family)
VPKTKMRIVTLDIDPAKPQPLAKKQRESLDALARMPETQIDYSDIPPIPIAFWDGAVRGGVYRPVKRQLSVRVDADILVWLKAQGKGYQTRINRLLRAAMRDFHDRGARILITEYGAWPGDRAA